MAAHANITRRAAIVGATATVTTISPALAAVCRTGAQCVNDRLRELATQFKIDAMAIDPTIKGMWLGEDLTVPGRDVAVSSLYFEREHSPFIRRSKTRE